MHRTKDTLINISQKLNIKLRWKFFVILLVFSLTPLLAVTVGRQWGIKILEKTIVRNENDNLTQIVGKELKQAAEHSAKVFLQTKDVMEFYLQVLTGETERILTESPPPPSRIYFAKDFENPKTAPPDFLQPTHYFIRSDDETLLPNPVSFKHPVYLLAPGIAKKDVYQDILRLTRLIPTFQKLSNESGKKIYWIYVSLNNGIHVSYPGHRGFPKNYDPRMRPWFKNAKVHATWTRPFVDITTRRMIFTVSKRIHGPDGSFLGVAAIDILITELLQASDLFPLWSAVMSSFMVTSSVNPGTQKASFQILAKKDYQTNVKSWKGAIENEWLSIPKTAKFEKIVKKLKSGKSGFTDLTFRGQRHIWAYADIDGDTHFVVIVPKSVAMTLSDTSNQTFQKYSSDQLIFTGMTALIVLIVLTIAAFIGSRAITRSLLQIAEAAKQLSEGNFAVRLNLKTGDERDQVIQAFNEMGPKLQEHFRINQSLDLAMKIQQKLLPSADPKVADLDVAGKSIYCDETGGDYYDYLEIQENLPGTINIVVGDVSGHGVSSALLMASARAYLRQRSSLPGSLAQIISDVNKQLAADVAEYNNFMTLFYLNLNSKLLTARWVRAGHDPAIFYDPHSDTFEELRGPGIALGIEQSYVYEENTKTDLSEGQLILIGTDGAWEARNRKGDMFGKERVYELIRKHANSTANDILNDIFDNLSRFCAGNKFEDDVTLVVIKVK